MRHLVPALLAVVTTLSAGEIGPRPIQPQGDVAAVVAMMTGDAQAVGMFRSRGLDVLNLTWEDTGRWQNSSVGPNISDLTIQVLGQEGIARGGCMPVVRRPNFADVTCDVPLDRFRVLIGNEHGAALRPVDLRTYLDRFAEFQHAPTGWLNGPLLSARDRVALTSAQACFLPVPQGGEARFAPVLFNYQSMPGSPAVLAILVTPEGTSAQVIENNPAASAGVSHGQRLFHNADGQRSALSATRFSDFRRQEAREGRVVAGDADTAQGLSLCMVIQVPLLVPERPRTPMYEAEASGAADACNAPACAKAMTSDVETAVVRAGPPEGPWLGLNSATIRRDERFPIRVTVQFYQATSSAAVSPADVSRISAAIDRVYLDADAVGSLVVDGWTGRPTAHTVQPTWPQPWYQEPCTAWQQTTGQPWAEGMRRLHERLGADWQPRDARELANALALVR